MYCKFRPYFLDNEENKIYKLNTVLFYNDTKDIRFSLSCYLIDICVVAYFISLITVEKGTRDENQFRIKTFGLSPYS